MRVLQVALAAVAGWDLKTVCSLLQVSTACRTAVLGSGVGCEVSIGWHDRHSISDPASNLHISMQLAHFCAWLPGHASLVRKLVLRPPSDLADAVLSQQLVSLALQLSVQQAAAAVAGGAVVQQVTPAGLPRPLQRLQLQSLDCQVLLQPAALAALASCSVLTELSMLFLSPRGLPADLMFQSAPGLHSSLGLLTSLRRISIGVAGKQALSGGFPASLAQLSNLTELDCDGTVPPDSLVHLPAQLSVLKVAVDNTAAAEVFLQHMGALRELQLVPTGGRSGVQAFLPTSLTSFKTIAAGPLQIAPASLPNVVQVIVAVRDIDSLACLRCCSNMTFLRFSCIFLAPAGELSVAQAGAVAAAIATATNLQSLELHRAKHQAGGLFVVAPHAHDSCTNFAECVSRMTQLSQLTITGFKVDPLDMIKLSVLPKLVSLSLLECSGLGDTTAAVLACKQTGLTALRLQGCGLQSPVLLPALAGCTGLQELDLRGNELPLCDETLLSLTALRQLTRLVLHTAASTVSADGRQQFKATMPQLRQLRWM